MENFLLFLISKITLNIDLNECIKYIINNINVKTTLKKTILILEIIILSNTASKVCELSITITEKYIKYAENISNNILFNIIQKLDEFFTWKIIYDNLPIYYHLYRADSNIPKDIAKNVTTYRETI